MLAQPDHVLSLGGAFEELDQIVYTMGNPTYVHDAWPGLLVKKELNSVLETICVDLREELFLALDEHLGFDTNGWKEIDLIETLRVVIAQASSRFTVGLPLCMLAYSPTSDSRLADSDMRRQEQGISRGLHGIQRRVSYACWR
jgi:hypothetical protein